MYIAGLILISPIFSFGLLVTMTEAKFVALIVKAYLEGAHRDGSKPSADCQVLGLMTDVFAARAYDCQPSEVVMDFRSVLPRERTYDHEDDYSIPIGSRYHPERALLWETNSAIKSTEEWMGSR